MGYEVILVFIHLDNVMLNQARIAQRVSEGGYNIPEDKVSSRIPRTLLNIKRVLPLCGRSYLLDNPRLDNPFEEIASVHDGKVISRKEPLPEWAKTVLNDYLG